VERPYSGTVADGPNPYDALDPVPAARRPTGAEPSASRALWRGMTRRCPRCGSGQLFRRWLKIRDQCPRCGLRLEREEGGFLGAMTVNYAVTTVVWLVVLIVWLVLDLPGVHLAALTVTSVLLVGLFPLVFFPFSKTIWAAVDYLVYRSSPDYRARDAADRSGGNGGRYS
jgi:uncharacterized protein (DUF983 family)